MEAEPSNAATLAASNGGSGCAGGAGRPLTAHDPVGGASNGKSNGDGVWGCAAVLTGPGSAARGALALAAGVVAARIGQAKAIGRAVGGGGVPSAAVASTSASSAASETGITV
eukprot:1034486-Prymnesium_polylepis.1